MNEPQVIYLQVGEDYNAEEDDYNETDEVTWCVDAINGNDLEYSLITADALKELREENAALKEELETRGMAAEQALTDICQMLKAPEWEYPGQVVRDVKMLVEKSRAVIFAYGDYCFYDSVEDLSKVHEAITNMAAYL